MAAGAEGKALTGARTPAGGSLGTNTGPAARLGGAVNTAATACSVGLGIPTDEAFPPGAAQHPAAREPFENPAPGCPVATSQTTPEADGAPVIRPVASGSAQMGQTQPLRRGRPLLEASRTRRGGGPRQFCCSSRTNLDGDRAEGADVRRAGRSYHLINRGYTYTHSLHSPPAMPAASSVFISLWSSRAPLRGIVVRLCASIRTWQECHRACNHAE
jgi:hypothetical protein